jgi:hypothetical protein
LEVKNYFQNENKIIEKGGVPSHELQLNWLEQIADKYSGAAIKFAEYKGVTLVDDNSLLKG